MSYTYDAFDGQREYTRTAPDGTVNAGMNQPDQSIVGLITHAPTDAQIVNYLEQNRLTPTMVARAFNACGLDGVRSVLDGVKRSPELAAWYATQPALVEIPWVTPTPAPTVDLGAEGQALISALEAYVQKVQAR